MIASGTGSVLIAIYSGITVGAVASVQLHGRVVAALRPLIGCSSFFVVLIVSVAVDKWEGRGVIRMRGVCRTEGESLRRTANDVEGRAWKPRSSVAPGASSVGVILRGVGETLEQPLRPPFLRAVLPAFTVYLWSCDDAWFWYSFWYSCYLTVRIITGRM